MAAHGKSRWVTRVGPLYNGVERRGNKTGRLAVGTRDPASGPRIQPTGLQKRNFMKLSELKHERAFALAKAENILKAAESADRKLTETEESDYSLAMRAVDALNPQIGKIERQNTLRSHFPDGRVIPATGNLRQAHTPSTPKVLSAEYYDDFHSWVGSRGESIGAALYEGSGSAGGFTVPILVDGVVVPLAPTEMGVRSLAT